MSEIDKRINHIKHQLQQVYVPDDLVEQMEVKLEKTPTRKNRFKQIAQYISVFVAVILISLIAYNHQSLAYYGKKILGFDHIYGTVGILNDEEKGQVIEETIELEKGLFFTVNGIMTDPNQLVLFYTFSAPDGLDQFDTSKYNLGAISGFNTRATASSGISRINDLGTEQRGIYHYSAVHPMAKKLKLVIWNFETDDFKELTFPHDPNKAMQASLDVPINESIPLGIGTLTIETVTASPTMTLVKGSIKGIENSNVNVSGSLFGIKLLANGHTVGRSGARTTHEEGTGIVDFEIDFNALPEEVEELKIFVEKFSGYDEVNDTLSINEDDKTNPIDFHGEEIKVTDITVSNQKMHMTVISDENVLLDGLSIEINGQTIEGELIEDLYGFQRELKRIYQFDTDEIPSEINVKGMYYVKDYDKEIEIPVK